MYINHSRFNKALNITLANADIKEKFARTGTEPTMSTPEGLEKIRLAEIEKWRPVILASGLRRIDEPARRARRRRR